jgi:hypothetical protein
MEFCSIQANTSKTAKKKLHPLYLSIAPKSIYTIKERFWPMQRFILSRQP